MIEQLRRLGPVFRPEFAFTGRGNTDFFVRVHRAGWKIVIAEDSVIVWCWEPDRVTLRGALRRTFHLGATSMHINRDHLPPSEFQAIRHKFLKKLYRLTFRLMITAFMRQGSIRQLQKLVNHIGRVYGGFGGRYRYYR